MKQGLFNEAKANILRPLKRRRIRHDVDQSWCLADANDNFEAAMKVFDRSVRLIRNPYGGVHRWFGASADRRLQNGVAHFDMAIAMENITRRCLTGALCFPSRKPSGGLPGLFESCSLRPPRRPCVFISRFGDDAGESDRAPKDLTEPINCVRSAAFRPPLP